MSGKMGRTDMKLNIKYAFMQACYWFITAAAMVFVVALLRERGFSDAEVGNILSVKYLLAVISQFVLSNIVDRLIRKISLKTVIYGLSLLSAVTTLLFYFLHMGYIGTAVCFGIFGCTINGVYPYINTIATKFSHSGRKIYYSYARGVGSIMWGVASVLLSWSVSRFGIESILLIQFTMTVLQILSAWLLDDVPVPEVEEGEEKQEKQVHSYLYLFRKYPGYTLFLIASVCMFIANNLLSTFMVDIVAKAGGGNRELGYVELALALFELPPAVLFITLSKRIGVKKILCTSIVSTFLQIVLTMCAGNIVTLILVQTFQIFGVGMYWTASVYYVSQEIPEQDWVKGQALVNICSLGLGGVVGSFISGHIMENFGLDTLMRCSAMIVAAGIVIMYAGMRKSNKYQLGGM